VNVAVGHGSGVKARVGSRAGSGADAQPASDSTSNAT